VAKIVIIGKETILAGRVLVLGSRQEGRRRKKKEEEGRDKTLK